MLTPTPWEARKGSKTVYSAVYVAGTQFAVALGCKREDAEFIVRACNSHAELLEALKWCANHLKQIAERDYPNATPEARMFNSERAARAAIEKAGG